MSALTEERNTLSAIGRIGYMREVATSNTVYAGAIVAQNSDGKAVPASDATGLITLGVAENTTAAGKNVAVTTGMFILDNGTSAEALAVTDIGATAYALDDHTVGKLGGTYKIPVGVVLDVRSEGVVVEINPCALRAAAFRAAAAVADATSGGELTTLNALLAALRAANHVAPNA